MLHHNYQNYEYRELCFERSHRNGPFEQVRFIVRVVDEVLSENTIYYHFYKTCKSILSRSLLPIFEQKEQPLRYCLFAAETVNRLVSISEPIDFNIIPRKDWVIMAIHDDIARYFGYGKYYSKKRVVRKTQRVKY
jgi:hypothetical protein